MAQEITLDNFKALFPDIDEVKTTLTRADAEEILRNPTKFINDSVKRANLIGKLTKEGWFAAQGGSTMVKELSEVEGMALITKLFDLRPVDKRKRREDTVEISNNNHAAGWAIVDQEHNFKDFFGYLLRRIKGDDRIGKDLVSMEVLVWGRRVFSSVYVNTYWNTVQRRSKT